MNNEYNIEEDVVGVQEDEPPNTIIDIFCSGFNRMVVSLTKNLGLCETGKDSSGYACVYGKLSRVGRFTKFY